MKKLHRTKTGTTLLVIEGGAEGDGIPRGQLQLVDENYKAPKRVNWFEWTKEPSFFRLRFGSLVYEFKRVETTQETAKVVNE